MGVRKKKVIHRIGLKVGRFFANFRAIIWVLLFYLIISLVTFLVLAYQLHPNHGKAAFIAFEVATGGDPYNFSNDLSKFTFLWLWILFLHLISWLIVPILMATAIDAAYRTWENRRLDLKKSVESKMDEVLALVDLTPEEKARRKAEAVEILDKGFEDDEES